LDTSDCWGIPCDELQTWPVSPRVDYCIDLERNLESPALARLFARFERHLAAQ